MGRITNSMFTHNCTIPLSLYQQLPKFGHSLKASGSGTLGKFPRSLSNTNIPLTRPGGVCVLSESREFCLRPALLVDHPLVNHDPTSTQSEPGIHLHVQRMQACHTVSMDTTRMWGDVCVCVCV